MDDFFKSYLKYKTKYLNLKKTIGGEPPKLETNDDSAHTDPISILKAEFLKRDDELQRQLSNLTEQMNLLREQIARNREFMLGEISKLHSSTENPSLVDKGVAVVLSDIQSSSIHVDKSSIPVASVPKRNTSIVRTGTISTQLNAILTDKSLEGPEKLDEKLAELDEVYMANTEICDTTDDKGLVTLLLRYACLKRDDTLIAKLFDRLTMTRDYLLLMAYHLDKRDDNIQLFREKINLDKIDQNNIDFIIDKGLLYLLPLLEGRFIKLSTKEGLLSGGSVEGLRPFYIPNPEYYIDKICNLKMEVGVGKEKDKLLVVECTSSQKKDRRKMQTLLETDPTYNNYNVIIDGGNLMHVGGGKNVQNIVNAFQELTKLGLIPLVVLYHKHTKDASVVAELNRNGVKYIGTPGSNDDDLFTLLAFLNNSKKQLSCKILTNDKYKKWFAVYKHTHEGQEKNLEGFVSDALLEYNIAPNGSVHISTSLLPYSQCIQVVGETVYFPSVTHGLVKPMSI